MSTSGSSEDTALGETSDLADKLLAFSQDATDLATTCLGPNWTAGARRALDLMRAAREALEARRIAEEPLSEGERAATAEHVKALRAQVATAREALGDVIEQRDDFAKFLRQLATQFESAETDTAARIAARIRRELAAIPSPSIAEALSDG